MSRGGRTGATRIPMSDPGVASHSALTTAEAPQLCEQVVSDLIAAGAAAVGVCSVEVLTGARATLLERHSAGLHGGMQFTFRNPERSTDPLRTLPSARSAVVVAMAYPSTRPPEPERPVAEVARYASSDTYGELRTLLRRGAEVLRSQGHRGVVLADDNALVDRSMAVRAGIGWIGKNSNVLVPGAGSWVVLGNILTDAELPHLRRWATRTDSSEATPGSSGNTVSAAARPRVATSPQNAIEAGCGPCRRCITSCPTDAIPAPGVVDPSRCLSWLLQRTGEFPREHRCALGTRIYGCDDCQTSCPPSTRAAGDNRAFVEIPTNVEHPGDWVDIVELLTLPDEALLERFGAWYIPERDPRYLRRNALVVMGNTGARRGGLAPGNARGGTEAQLRALLRRYLGDVDPLLVQHAAWAARRAGAEDLLAEEPWRSHPEVIAELSRPAPRSDEDIHGAS